LPRKNQNNAAQKKMHSCTVEARNFAELQKLVSVKIEESENKLERIVWLPPRRIAPANLFSRTAEMIFNAVLIFN
jgi:hypothetical protein